jgi:hypothetical protein
MIIDGCEHWTIMRCHDARSNKLWGYFCHDECWYTFWCGVGQAVSFKSHGTYKWDLPNLTTKKQKKGYETITLEQLLTLDTNFKMTFSEKFTFVKLMQSVGDA